MPASANEAFARELVGLADKHAVPLVIGMGEGSEFRQPLGITIIGGLVLSQILTLYTTPVVYLYLDRFAHWTRRKRRRG